VVEIGRTAWSGAADACGDRGGQGGRTADLSRPRSVIFGSLVTACASGAPVLLAELDPSTRSGSQAGRAGRVHVQPCRHPQDQPPTATPELGRGRNGVHSTPTRVTESRTMTGSHCGSISRCLRRQMVTGGSKRRTALTTHASTLSSPVSHQSASAYPQVRAQVVPGGQ
jgi:hypothetical protein